MQSPETDLARLMRVVRRRRESKRWTVNHLAESAGISGVYLNGMEKGKGRRPGVQVVARLARALGTTTDALLIESGLMEPPADWQAGRQPLDVYLRETSPLRDDDIHAVTHLVSRLSESATRSDALRVAESPEPFDDDGPLDMGRGYNAASTDQGAIDEHQQGREDERGEASPD